MPDILLYQREDGRSPFADWFDAPDSAAATEVTVAIEKMRVGNLASLKGVGEGVQEFRIDWGRATASISAEKATRWSSC